MSQVQFSHDIGNLSLNTTHMYRNGRKTYETIFSEGDALGNIRLGITSESALNVYSFKLPKLNTVLGRGDINFGFYPLISYGMSGVYTKANIGKDLDNDGVLDDTNEIISLNNASVLGKENIIPFDSSTSRRVEQNILQGNQEYFFKIEHNSSNFSVLNADFIPSFTGEISQEDNCYSCNGQKYYYDELTGLNIKAGTSLTVGEEINLTVYSPDFAPRIFVEVVDDFNGSEEFIVSDGGYPNFRDNEFKDTEIPRTFQPTGIDLFRFGSAMNITVEANKEYIISVETANPGETGEYILFIDDTI